MKTWSILALGFASLLPAHAKNKNEYVSIKNEVAQAIARGNAWLAEQQKEKGFWDDGGLPAFTALALTAAVRDPNLELKDG
jgi:squalene-hopene/tetraprenyl-beta-curcumene cyclase